MIRIRMIATVHAVAVYVAVVVVVKGMEMEMEGVEKERRVMVELVELETGGSEEVCHRVRTHNVPLLSRNKLPDFGMQVCPAFS